MATRFGRFRRSKLTRSLASIALVLVAAAMVAITSLALFTDSASVDDNAFSTGTIDISTAPSTALVTMTGMSPGDQVSAPLAVSNDGTLELRYAITSTTTENVLAAELDLTVKSGVTTCDDANWTVDGTELYSGILGTDGTIAVVGSVAAGADAGDRVLAASGSEDLCFNVTLPLSTTAGSGLSTTATFSFSAEQTDNNP
jgi:predicted ribosomally synthesized peptide with SipW-like signal peptide